MGIKAQVHPDVGQCLTKALSTVEPSDLASMSQRDLLAVQSMIGYGSTWGVWEIPIEWATPGSRTKGSRIVSIASALPAEIEPSSEQASAIWMEVVKLGLLRAMVPTERRPAAPGTVLGIVATAARLAKAIAAKQSDQNQFWGRLTIEEASACTNRFAYNTIYSFMHKLHKRRLLSDRLQVRIKTKGTSPERNRHNDPAPAAKPKHGRTYQALPDAFVAQCGWRVLWMIKQLGPTLLDAIEAAVSVAVPPSTLSVDGAARERSRDWHQVVTNSVRDPVIANWDWRTPDGQRIDSLPFELAIKRRHGSDPRSGKVKPPFEWPPKTFSEAITLLNQLQTAHAWILFLLAGPRVSEVLSYDEDCVVEIPTQPGNRVEGRTYKFVRHSQGRKRDFPAPKIAISVALQQVRLARLAKQIGDPANPDRFGKHLWVIVGTSRAGNFLDSWSHNLDALATFFRLKNLLDPSNPRVHTHRFRKTLARLVALTMVNAQMILMDCFGHDDPEIALISYILSDKRIHADVVAVQKELVILLAVDVISNASSLGGPMGERVREKVAERILVLKKDTLGPADIYELAQDMTLNGRIGAIVTPGVICFLPPGGTGPCSKRQGGRDPGNCRSNCGNQVLMDFNKVETDETIAHIVPLLERAISDENEVMVAYLKGQLSNWLYRWRDVFDKWAPHPVVAANCPAWTTNVEIAA